MESRQYEQYRYHTMKKSPVGLSCIDNRWYVLYSTGESKRVCYLWRYAPKDFRSWYLYRRKTLCQVSFSDLVG